MPKNGNLTSKREIKISSKTNQPYEVLVIYLETEDKKYELGRLMLSDVHKGLLDQYGISAQLN